MDKRYFNEFVESIQTDLETFLLDTELQNKKIKYYTADNKETINEGYLKHFIDLGAGNWLVGIENTTEDKIQYHLLTNITFWVEKE